VYDYTFDKSSLQWKAWLDSVPVRRCAYSIYSMPLIYIQLIAPIVPHPAQPNLVQPSYSLLLPVRSAHSNTTPPQPPPRPI
jgi:hypothetical protein